MINESYYKRNNVEKRCMLLPHWTQGISLCLLRVFQNRDCQTDFVSRIWASNIQVHEFESEFRIYGYLDNDPDLKYSDLIYLTITTREYIDRESLDSFGLCWDIWSPTYTKSFCINPIHYELHRQCVHFMSSMSLLWNGIKSFCHSRF